MTRRLVYVANARLPSEKAHVNQIVQMCDGFEAAGVKTTLVVPERRNHLDLAPETYFDTPFRFEYVHLPVVDLIWLNTSLPYALKLVTFYIEALTFALVAVLHVWREDYDVIYTRALLFFLIGSMLYGDRMIVELHRRPSRGWVTRLLGLGMNRVNGIVVISKGLYDVWRDLTQTPIAVEPDGVRLDRYSGEGCRSIFRDRFELPRETTIVGYTGSLQPWKGVDTLVEAARRLPDDVEVCVVGGRADQIAALRENHRPIPETVRFVEQVTPDAAAAYQRACDILVVPNTSSRRISTHYTSPLKVFEYMAANRPIIASDVPSLREILEDDTAFFVRPDDPTALAETILEVRSAPETAMEVAEHAHERVQSFTWEARAQRIIATFLCPTGRDG